MYASVIIDVSSSNVDYEYEYAIPQELLPLAFPGVRVKVSFGKANRLVMGYIIEIYQESRYDGAVKVIEEVLDLTPLITTEQLRLAQKLKIDTYSPLVRILNLMIPQNLRLRTTKYLVVEDFNKLDANLALHFGGKVKLIYDKSLLAFQRAITKGLKEGYLKIEYEAHVKGKVKKITKYRLNKEYYYQNINFLTPLRYQEGLSSLLNEMPLSSGEIIEKYGFTRYMIKKLVSEGFLIEIYETESRIKDRTIDYQDKIKLNLETLDQTIINNVDKMKKSVKPTLWIPKTESEELTTLSLLVVKTLKEGNNILIVCPDILSSYRLTSFLNYQTGLDIACLNSDRSKAEILDYYQAIRDDEYQIIVTTPIGAFFPYQNIKTIIMFDSENSNYYNDQSPRYDLKVVMNLRAHAFQSQIIYHSLVPNLEIYSEALVKQYQIITGKNEKFNYLIKVVDMTEELRGGNRLPLSHESIQALKERIKNNEQSLLILNNRGYSQSILCRSCGKVINCPKCNIPLRYHKLPDAIVCPICSYKQTFDHTCPSCGSDKIRHMGLGIERLVEVIHQMIPNAKTLIVDQNNFNDFEEKMEQIIDNEVNIIITSDLFERSIVNDKISLVVIIALDIVAKSPFYDANHRAYALLSHAKMNLHNEKSEMIIQTYDPKMPFLASFIKDDFDEYFKDELKLREVLRVTPIYHVNRILIKAPYGENFSVALNLKKAIYNLIKYVIIIGPVYNQKEKAVQLIIKHQNTDIYQIYENLYKTFQDDKITVVFDKYPKAIT